MGNNSFENNIIEPKIEITMDNLEPEILNEGETEFVVQRHAADNRDPHNSSLELGELEAESAEKVRAHSENFFDKIFESLSKEERETVNIIVVAADSKLGPIEGEESDYKRAVETAKQVIAGIKSSTEKYPSKKNPLLNRTGEPIEISEKLNDPHFLRKSPEFVEFLTKNEEETGETFWATFESDAKKEVRKSMGAEGPDEIVNRLDEYLQLMKRAMKCHHKKNPESRTIVWIVTHYDTISPYIKKIADLKKTDFVPVKNGAGIVIKIGKDNEVTTKIAGKNYNISL